MTGASRKNTIEIIYESTIIVSAPVGCDFKIETYKIFPFKIIQDINISLKLERHFQL